MRHLPDGTNGMGVLDLVTVLQSDAPYLNLLFGAGVMVHVIGHRQEWHRKYLDYRALAEGLRVQVYWNLAGVIETHAVEFAYDNFLQKQDVDLAWRQFRKAEGVLKKASDDLVTVRRQLEQVLDDLSESERMSLVMIAPLLPGTACDTLSAFDPCPT